MTETTIYNRHKYEQTKKSVKKIYCENLFMNSTSKK